MRNLQEAANKPPVVTCAISKCISAAYHRLTFLRTLSILLHGAMTSSSLLPSSIHMIAERGRRASPSFSSGDEVSGFTHFPLAMAYSTPSRDERPEHPGPPVILAEEHQRGASHLHLYRDRLASRHILVDMKLWDRHVVQHHSAIVDRQGDRPAVQSRHAGRAEEEIARLNRDLTTGCSGGSMHIRTGRQPGGG